MTANAARSTPEIEGCDFEQSVEQACVFGSHNALTGVYTPALVKNTNANVESPCALFLTAGLLHHVGPTRLHVELARALSDQGVPGLRFDLSGVGDSETGSLGGYFMERSVQEVVQCMDFVQANYGHQQFVLFGLCSGADDALVTALQDQRVVGIALLNGYAYPAGLFKVHRLLSFYLPRLLTWSKIRNRAKAIVGRVFAHSETTYPSQTTQTAAAPLENGVVINEDDSRKQILRIKSEFNGKEGATVSAADQAALNALDDDYRYIPPRETTAENLVLLAEQGTDLLFIYTGSEHDAYTYEGQLFAMFPGLKGSALVTEHYLKQADHTVILEEDRCQVIEAISQWFKDARFARQTTR